MRRIAVLALFVCCPVGCSPSPPRAPVAGATGEPCTSPSSCASMLCVAMGDARSVCTEPCTDSTTCPARWTCEPFGSGRLCVCDEACASPIDAGPSMPRVDASCADGACSCECDPGERETLEREVCASGGERVRSRSCSSTCAWSEPTWTECSEPASCVRGSLRCEGACVDCPTEDVADVACDGAACVAAACVAGAVPCGGACCRFVSEVVDDVADAGRFASMAIEASGEVSIAYTELERRVLRFARGRVGGPWATRDVDARGAPTGFVSLALGADGLARIAYYAVDAQSLRVATESATSFDIEPVDGPEASRGGDAGWFTSIAIHPDGRPRVSYYDFTRRALRYASRGASGWSITPLDPASTDVGQYTSIALDASGRPWIAYRDEGRRALRVAHYDGTAWRYELADAAGDAGTHTSIAIDRSGVVRIAYRVVSTDDLYLATRSTGGRWTTVPVATDGTVGAFASLALDAAGRAHIAYRDASQRALGYASERPDGSFALAAIDTDGDVGDDPFIVLDARERPLIAHRDVARGALRLTHAE